ncbi:MAG: MFS transporter [Eubacterium sp.]|nr:MFS transporter [Eubacterium sp.]
MSTTTSSKNYGIGVQVAALSVALLMYTTSMTTPALAEIAKAFPNAAAETIQLLSTIPSLMMVLFSLVSGKLTEYISIKKIIIISMVLIFVGGIPSAFFGDLNFMIAMRVIFGAGFGMVFPMASAVITDLFTGDQGNRLMGFKSAVGAAAGVVFQFAGGILASYNWRWSFLGFLLVLPIAILIWIKLPDTGVKKSAPTEGSSAGKVKKLTSMTYIITLACFLFNIFQFSFMTNVAMVMSADQIGDATQSSMVLSIFSAASFVIGLLYGSLSKVTKKFTAAIGVLCVGIALTVMLTASSYALFLVAAVIFGIGFGIFNPSMTMAVAGSAAEPKFAALAISIYTCGTGIGQFISPYVLKFLRSALGLESTRANWQIASVALIVGAIIALVIIAFSGKKARTETSL